MSLDFAWLRELRHAARRLIGAPGFATIAVVTLAIGVGVNAAMFGLIDALLFRPPFAVSDPDRVVRIQFTSGEGPDATTWQRANYPALTDVAMTGAFETVAGYTGATVSLGRGADAFEASAMIVTPHFFKVLGVRPHAGTFGDDGDSLAGNYIMLSHGVWESRYGSDPSTIGRAVEISGSSYTVAGVLPKGFFSLQERPVDVWLPMNELAATHLFRRWRENRGSFWLHAVGRLPEGLSPEAVEARADAAMSLAAREIERAPNGIALAPLVGSRGDSQAREVRVSLWLAAVTAFVLLIACANVANLVLARNVARAPEYAVRLSLGASAWQLRRQLLADVIVLAIPGFVAATLVEYMVRRLVPAFLPAEIPFARTFLDGRSLLFMVASAALAVAFVAVVSLVQVRPDQLARSLSLRAREQRHGGRFLNGSLVATQSALCVALLFSAGLFARSLGRVLALDLGVDLDRTVQVNIATPRGERTREELLALHERALDRVRAHRGVERAAMAQGHPFQSGSGSGPFTADRSQEELWAGKGEVGYSAEVGPGFFGAVGATTLEGRDFTEADNASAPKVAIINAPMAARLFPRGNALGTCIFLDDSRECHRVIGVLGGVWKMRALDRTKMAIYTPLAQSTTAPGALLVRTRGDASRMVGELRSLVQSIDPTLPAVQVRSAMDLIDWEIRPWRLGAIMFAGFSGVALVIAAVGLFGVVSFATTRRRREIGVRMALGSPAADIARVVAGSGLIAVAVGLLIGAAASLVASRWMGDLLYETSPRDPMVLAQTVAVLLFVALIAVVAPVARSLRMAPADVLRSE